MSMNPVNYDANIKNIERKNFDSDQEEFTQDLNKNDIF